MASLKDIRRRIESVKNTRKITRAMKLVAAAKMRRAQESILCARPYAYQLHSMLVSLGRSNEDIHPLLIPREEKKIKVVVVGGDRGLCGSFNSSVFKVAHNFVDEKRAAGLDVVVDTIGKKSAEYFAKRIEVEINHEGLLDSPKFTKVGSVADAVIEGFLNQEVDGIYLVYNTFKSAISQVPTVEKLVPMDMEDLPEGVQALVETKEASSLIGPILEPSKEVLLKDLLAKQFRTQVFRAVLESVASEHAARMSAMENATNNASDMIDSLTLEYNKARQAAITTELMEIVGGVEAMR